MTDVDLASLPLLSDAGRTAAVYLWDDQTVLKLARNAGYGPPFAREAIALQAASAVPGLAPGFQGSVTIDGRPGLLMDRLHGVDLLKELERKPWRVWRIGRELAVEHVRLHALNATPEMETARERVAFRLKSDAIPAGVRRRALDCLAQLPDGNALCHVDFHPGNLMRTPQGLRIIDFSNACAGDPDWDHTITLSLLELGEVPPSTPWWMRILVRLFRRLLLASYRRNYRRLRPVNAANLERWRTVFLAQRLDDRIPEERPRLLSRLASRGRRTDG